MTLYYIQTNAICLTILIVVFSSMRIRRGIVDARRIAFLALVVTAMIMCVSDALAWFTEGKSFPGVIPIMQISNIIYYISMTACGYLWLTYVNFRLRDIGFDHKKSMLLTSVPLIVMAALLISNPLTHLIFSIDSNAMYSRGVGVFIHWIISYAYLFVTTIMVLARLAKSKSRVEKSTLWPLVLFIIPPLAAAVLQTFFYGTTLTQCGTTVSILIIALTQMTDEVSKDSLTGLNNRRALDDYITEQISKENNNLTLLMCDIDNFKSINDTKGHAIGDLVLKRMSEALKTVCADRTKPYFLCRFGGDEFVICGPQMSEDEALLLISELKAAIRNINEEKNDNNSFSISVGHASGICHSAEDVEKLLTAADEIMYVDKKNKKK